MNSTLWILEEDAYDDNHQKLIDDLNDRGQKFQCVKYTMGGLSGLNPFMDYDGPVVYRGSIQGARAFEREYYNLEPGVLCDWDKYACSYYYPKFKQYLLNKPNVMLPYGALLEPEQMELLYSALGEDRTVFIRPDSGFKTFTGKPVYKENYERDIEGFGFYKIDHDAMVLVSKPVNIMFEERLVIHNKKVVTGSRYRQLDKHSEAPILHPDSVPFAEQVLRDIDWEPEPLWILDLAHTKTGIKVLEIGAFTVAGLYQCDVHKIVDAVNQAASDMWKDLKEV